MKEVEKEDLLNLSSDEVPTFLYVYFTQSCVYKEHEKDRKMICEDFKAVYQISSHK
ncbi:hypothetical protein TEHD86_1352 [Tetragenococcus halophilus subsp. halophilus]|nr:hypothetical protein TEHD10_1967 [Tetragenococcus halophilus subsp. halophilus]GBD82630.1 hypothetical protein TEHD86_1352 [Tetragenococcus halophilus subsp. halophilus]